MKIQYASKKPNRKTTQLIAKANEIINHYITIGEELTLRQLYYRLVSNGTIPNTLKSYKRLGTAINTGRLAGLVDWDVIEDRTRAVRCNQHWLNWMVALEDGVDSFALDKWEGQNYRPEVWVEKDALLGVVGRVCERLDIPYFSCRGNPSQSEVWRSGNRLIRMCKAGMVPVIIYMGDHDPTGIDITRDVMARLGLFTQGEGVDWPVERIALTMEQIEEYKPPPWPAKVTDSRYEGYVELYGEDCWELDALDPPILTKLIEDTVYQYRDDTMYAARVAEEDQQRAELRSVLEREVARQQPPPPEPEYYL